MKIKKNNFYKGLLKNIELKPSKFSKSMDWVMRPGSSYEKTNKTNFQS